MKSKRSLYVVLLFAFLVPFLFVNEVSALDVSFTKLTGETGGSPASTGVWRADLSGIGFDIASIRIYDNSSLLGGAPGQFSGFDLDAIMLSNTSVATAGDAKLLTGLSVFDFNTSGTSFTPGTQRDPVDPKLFGTGPTGATVDNSVATLGVLDGNSIAATPGAFGFVSMGDNGILSFNLTSPVSTSGNLYLYIGEAGDNGEVAAGRIEVSRDPQDPVPEPATMLLLGSGLIGLAGYGRKKFLKR